ncbi:MAG TPA: universal stress protein [Longimicrobiales bacterium]|nr:universal stress protein [Longimicrobiales bacterium]
MHDIVVPLDGSSYSEHAIPGALDLARRTRARLYLVQVHELVLPVPAVPELPVVAGEWDSALRAQEERYLESLADRCAEMAGLRPRTALLEGVVSAALASYAAEVGADLIVMTTHGRGGISRAWVGSVADALVRRAAVPVLLLRPTAERIDWHATLPAKHILVPLDGSALSESALTPALALGATTGARYTLLRVVLPLPFVSVPHAPPVFSDAGARQERADADVYLVQIATRLRAQGAVVAVEALLHSIPALGILDYANSHAVDAIVMATHGRGGWSRVALGSVADKVMRGTLLPVMLYRPTTAPDYEDIESYAAATAP